MSPRILRLQPPHGPAPTIRRRLTVLYGIVFLITGAVFLTLGYLLVRHNLGGRANYAAVRAELLRHGVIPPPFDPAFGHLRFLPGSPEARVAAVVRQQLRASALHRLLIEYIVALGGMTMISVAAGWLLAGRALRPLRQIIDTAQRVSAENLGERIALSGPADELKELADTFDSMLARLEATFLSQRHFVANASHELRTPLAIMRTEVDVALADPRATPEELREMGEGVRETIDRCERLIEALLTLARSEGKTGHEEPVDLAALAADCITDLHARAEEAGVQIHDDLRPAWTRGEPSLLERTIANLIDNGIRYNVAGGSIDVRTRSDGRWVTLDVLNTGAQIAAQDAEGLIEPFRRVGRDQVGFGLGLSIVASVIRAHGGTLAIRPGDQGGLHVCVRLPAQTASPEIRVRKESAALTRS